MISDERYERILAILKGKEIKKRKEVECQVKQGESTGDNQPRRHLFLVLVFHAMLLLRQPYFSTMDYMSLRKEG